MGMFGGLGDRVGIGRFVIVRRYQLGEYGMLLLGRSGVVMGRVEMLKMG
ncbi:hypothetical protein [Staphylococcus epidermidis]|nr:hypothetical protein [Staphylococcus epidermidis]